MRIFSKKQITMGAVLTSALALQACGSSGSSSSTATPTVTRTPVVTTTPVVNSKTSSFMDLVRKRAALSTLNSSGSGYLADSSANTADAGMNSEKGLDSSASVTLDDYGNAVKGPDTNAKFSDENTIILTMGDDVYALENDGNQISTFTNGDVKLFTPRTMEGNADSYTYARVANATKENGDFSGASGVVVFATGAETPAASLPTADASASYSGQTEFVYASTSDVSGRVSGDIALDVNFGQKTVDATMNNFYHETGNSQGTLAAPTIATGEIKMQNAAISGNGYSGSLFGTVEAGTRTVTVGGDNSKLSGKFFGPNAEETAGVLQINGVAQEEGNSAKSNVGVGSFIAKNTSLR